MTLAGAAKRLRDNREGVERNLEIIEKLQGMRALLLEVREELKSGRRRNLHRHLGAGDRAAVAASRCRSRAGRAARRRGIRRRTGRTAVFAARDPDPAAAGDRRAAFRPAGRGRTHGRTDRNARTGTAPASGNRRTIAVLTIR